MATLLRLVLAPLVGSALPFVTFFAAAILLAWYYGFWPAAFSILLSSVSGAHYVMAKGEPALAAWGRSQRATVIGFVATSLILCFLIDSQHRTLARARTAEGAQRRANEELQRANRDLEVFAYSASHDLQEPLRTIGTSAELMRRNWSKQLHEQDAVLLSRILSATQRMGDLIEDLLAYTRAVKPEEGPPPDVDSGRILAEVLDGLRASILESGASIEALDLPTIAIHERRLSQVFQNLISNAIKYRGPENPHIRVTADLQDGGWVFSVADNGIGIEPQFAQQIFGLFKRLHSQDLYPGSGIGLAVCQRIIEHYGGRVWLEESQPGKGSRFCFTVGRAQGGAESLVRRPADITARANA